MALVATPAAANADSYLTVAAANTLAGADLGPEADGWTPTVDASKEKALKRATREINAALDSGWAPFDPAAQRTSGLIFPREIDTDAGGVPIIPREIELATYEQAKFVLANASVIDSASTRRARNMQSAAEPNTSYSQPNPDELWNRLADGARHYLSGFRAATPPKSSGGLRSLRVSAGLVGAQ